MFANILIGCLFVKALDATETVPVFIIDQDNLLDGGALTTVKSNPFERTSPAKFSLILSQLALECERIIIFIEKQLCTEDISGRDEHGTPYYYLRQSLVDGKVKYFPAVASAYNIINKQFLQQKYNEIHLSSIDTSLNITDDTFNYLYAYFEDGANETRVAALRRHDLMMKQAYTVIRQMYGGPVIAIYTGMSNSIDIDKEMKKFQLFSERSIYQEPPDVMLFYTNTSIFEFRGMNLITNGRRWLQEQPWSVDETYNKSFIRTKLDFAGTKLEFNFILTNTDWVLDNVKMYEEDVEVGRLRTNIRAPWGYSYACNEKMVFENYRDGSVITIPRYQIEPIKEWLELKPSVVRSVGGRYFRVTISCGPFFSAPIMMSLFVVAILLAILFYGIVCIMDVRTNSRYDDPHGKQLMFADVGM